MIIGTIFFLTCRLTQTWNPISGSESMYHLCQGRSLLAEGWRMMKSYSKEFSFERDPSQWDRPESSSLPDSYIALATGVRTKLLGTLAATESGSWIVTRLSQAVEMSGLTWAKRRRSKCSLQTTPGRSLAPEPGRGHCAVAETPSLPNCEKAQEEHLKTSFSLSRPLALNY